MMGVLCPIYNHLSELIQKIYFMPLDLVSFKFEDGMYLSKRNFQVARYTNYIIDVTQDILILIKAIGFNHRPVPNIRVRLVIQEPNTIQSLSQMRTERCAARLKAIKCHPDNHIYSILRAKLRSSMSSNLFLTFSSQIGVLYVT